MVIAIFFVIGGAVMVFRLPVAQFPEIAPPQIQTTAMYTGADALTVEQSVATPTDAQVNGAKRMIYMQAISGNDGTMTLQVSFETDTDIDIDQVQVQNRLAQAQANLPQAVNNYGLTTIQTAGIPLLVFTITSPNKTWDQNFLSNYVVINVQDELARVPGIGQVRIFGAANYAMRVWVAPDTIAKLGLTVTDLVNAISAQNVVNPAGTIGGEPAPPGRKFTYTVRAQGRLMSAEEFGDIIVRANADGSLVRLKDVARLELGAENYTQQAYGNGAPATLVGLYQVPGSNALDAANRAKATMARLAERFPSDMHVDLTLDTTIPVTEGAKEIAITLLEAIGLVILVVFVFLQNWRATLIPILTIPVSLVGTFLFFPMLGFTINQLSLLGLVLAVGLVVDDAIVVVEAIEAKIEQGLSPRDAALAGDGRGERRARRHRPRALQRVHSRRLHRRHHRVALPAVRAHHRVVGPDLGLQRAHAEPRARRAHPPSAAQGRTARTRRTVLHRVRSRLHVGADGLRPGRAVPHPQGRGRAARARSRSRCSRAVSARPCPRRSCRRRTRASSS